MGLPNENPMVARREIRISPGTSSGQSSLAIAILLAALGAHNLFQAISRGGIADYIISVIQFFICGYFFIDWWRYRSGCWVMAYDQDCYEIRENGCVTTSGKFNELREIDQDGRGYTITTQDAHRFRLLRKVMDVELQRTLDSRRAEQIAVENLP
jgi:hypothetical protein